jgi:soluble lytic murein transglycosylase
LNIRSSIIPFSALMVAVFAIAPSAQRPTEGEVAAFALAPTSHPRVPRDLSLLWLAPGTPAVVPPAASRELATAMKLVEKGEYAKALSMLQQPSVEEGPLSLYAAYYAGLAEQALTRHADARRTFHDVLEHHPVGYLAEAAALAEAASAEALDDDRAAVEIYERLAAGRSTIPDEILMRLAKAARAAGDLRKSAEAYARVYYEFPLGDFADQAGTEFQALPNVQPIARGTERYALELGRADRLFGAKQYGPARAAFERVKPAAADDDRAKIQLRIAESDYHLKKYRAARDGLRPHLEKGKFQAEARYYHALVLRALGDRAGYRTAIQRIVDAFPTESWADEALNNLATDYILRDEDALADATFRELYDRNPRGAYSDRAAWKVGWRSYRERRYDETVKYFERAAVDFPRSDYRPAWLYWAGRAHEALNEQSLAEERFTLTTADYLNTYYGRLAVSRMHGRRAAPRVIASGADAAPSLLPPPANEPLVRALLDIDAYEQALNELRYAQRAWGDSSALQATMAWIYFQQGQAESGRRRFELLRGSISAMKRAYPQYMAAGGEELPRDVLSVIFPLDYWDLIKKYSTPNELDPYLVAALVAQESTFVRDIRSGANAYGLMQLVPSTARMYARRLNLRYSTTMLTSADQNMRMGTRYLADKVREFGGLHLALASYNAGERAVRRWIAERPGLTEREEFIDDIPYPETQNYVKKILGTAEDYRRLYGTEE